MTSVDTRVGCYCVIVENDALLLTHWNENGNTGWSLPGGGIEVDETTEQAAIRECFEESGLHVRLTALLDVDTYYVPVARRVTPNGDNPLRALRVIYAAQVVGGVLTAEVGGSSDAAEWFPLDALPADRVGLVDVGVAAFRATPGGSDPI